MPHTAHYAAGALVSLVVLWQLYQRRRQTQSVKVSSSQELSPSSFTSLNSDSPSFSLSASSSSPSLERPFDISSIDIALKQQCNTPLTPLWNLRRWSHTAHALSENYVLVFGGFGADNTAVIRAADGRMKSLVILNVKTGRWQPVISSSPACPPAREHHASVFWEGKLWVFGGRMGPHRFFDDLWSFDLRDSKWIEHKTGSDSPPGCFRHSAVLFNNQMVVFGGRTAEGFSNDTWVLDLGKVVWKKVMYTEERSDVHHASSLLSSSVDTSNCSNESVFGTGIRSSRSVLPAPRASHACFVHGNRMYVFGGLQKGELGDYCLDPCVYALNLFTWHWSEVRTRGQPPPALYSHSANVIGSLMICVGGSSADEVFQYTRVYVLNLVTHVWTFAAGSSWSLSHLLGSNLLSSSSSSSSSSSFSVTKIPPSRGFFTKHATCVIGSNRLLAVGGGGLCFSFGTHFSPTIIIDVHEGGLSATLHQPLEREPTNEAKTYNSIETSGLLSASKAAVKLPDCSSVSFVDTLSADSSNAQPSESISCTPGKSVPACRVCGETFASRNKLNAHVKISKHV